MRFAPRKVNVVSVTDGSVSFTAQSSTRTASSFTDRIGLEPTWAREMGDPVGNGSSGRRMTKSEWTLWVDYNTGGGVDLDAALLGLLSRFDDHLDEFDRLRRDFRCWVQFHGSSNSEQGGFVLGTATLQKVARLGVELLGTVYLQGTVRSTLPSSKLLRNSGPT